jgi:hypothetical protein
VDPISDAYLKRIASVEKAASKRVSEEEGSSKII